MINADLSVDHEDDGVDDCDDDDDCYEQIIMIHLTLSFKLVIVKKKK